MAVFNRFFQFVGAEIFCVTARGKLLRSEIDRVCTAADSGFKHCVITDGGEHLCI